MKDELEELAKRCEAATEPDQALDAQIHDALYGGVSEYDIKWNCWNTPGGSRVPLFTASIDAAMSLVPEGWWIRNLNQRSDGTRTWVALGGKERIIEGIGAAIPALALAAASLRTRSMKEGSHGEG